jgi:hypothetical protein
LNGGLLKADILMIDVDEVADDKDAGSDIWWLAKIVKTQLTTNRSLIEFKDLL